MTWLLLAFALQTAPDSEPIAFTNATVIVRPGETIEAATVLVAGGVIRAVGTAVAIPARARRIDATGLVVTAGFIDGDTGLGLPDLPWDEAARRPTEEDRPDTLADAPPFMREANRKGIRPQLRAADVIALDADAGKSHREAGFTAIVSAPGGMLLGGRSVLIALSGRARRTAILHPAMGLRGEWTAPGDDYPETGMAMMALLRQTLYDVRWYATAMMQLPAESRRRPPSDAALEAILPLFGNERLFFEADSQSEIRRALDLADEFHLSLVILGGREAHRFADQIAAAHIPVIFSLKPPDEPKFDPKDPDERPESVLEDEVRRRDESLRGPATLAARGVPIAFRTRGLKDTEKALREVARRVECGLPMDAALAALTSGAAEILEVSSLLGTVEVGKAAHLTVLTARPGDAVARVRYVVTDGRLFEFEPPDKVERPAPFTTLVGTWSLAATVGERRVDGTLRVRRQEDEVSGVLTVGEAKIDLQEAKFTEGKLCFEAEVADVGRLKFEADTLGDAWTGTVKLGDEAGTFTAERRRSRDADVELDTDRVPAASSGRNLLLRHATVLSLTDRGAIPNANVFIRGGRIERVEPGFEPREDVEVIDATGLYVMPGVIDCHSHIAGHWINEGSDAIVAEVRMSDSVDPDDAWIYRGATGGTTTVNLLHGSANPIGGQNAVLRLRFGRPAAELLFEGAPPGIKFALGENVMRANWSPDTRFPATRLGIAATYRRAFEQAREYQRRLADPAEAPVRRDLRLETLVEIMEGRRLVHCHCYRNDEILQMMRTAEAFGWRLATFQHILEGYQLAPELAAHGVGASTFADWWGYKFEAYDATPYNAALMTRAGVLTSINSDSEVFQRHLPIEAAKCMKYGGLTENEALALVTRNPAIQLRIDGRVGTVEPGKDADLSVFNGHPLSPYSRCVMTLVDGEIVYDGRDGPSNPTPGFRPSERTRREPLALAPERGAYAIRGATIYPVTADPIERGTILMEGGRIAAVGRDVRIPPDTTVIDGAGLCVYPGMIDAYSQVGLIEVESVRGTRDTTDVGAYQPDLLAVRAVHPDSEYIPVTRANGLTTVLVVPGGGTIPGQSALVGLDGWTVEEMALVDAVGLHVRFPPAPAGDDKDERKKREERIKELREYFQAAKRYADAMAANEPVEPDTRYEAMVPYVRGEKPVIVHADGRREIRAAVKWAEEVGVRMILAGGLESWKVAALLAEKEVPVILTNVWRGPAERYDPYTMPYACAARLHAAGVRFAIATEDSSNSRNLPYHAAVASAYGLDRAEALRAVTIRPAEILGVADRVGSLEVGKRADVIVTTGDPLEVVTDVVAVFVAGTPVSLETRHTRLYDHWRRRLEER